ncbi:hypothetical protein HJC23_004318 [Cyclotella cryptica]|uniref:Uncharacterized protein n=1 Tax=Cyclotella cryptica TaxID=29204 RepID=A0ABD3Q5X9_9STRA|eukprot:CCRYP_008937-RA/>CCRYP_008937-RA protein AED:0.00 eAED:0.00 QI:102/1/1/1/0/0/2/58/515
MPIYTDRGREIGETTQVMKCLRTISLSSLLLTLLITRHRIKCDASSSNIENEQSHRKDGQSGGRIVQSLFRFPASRLGREFNELIQLWYDEWLGVPSTNTTSITSTLPAITPVASGKKHAAHSVSATVATIFRRQCYGPLTTKQQTLYKNLEQRRKEIEFQYLKDPMDEMKLLHNVVKRFYPAFLSNTAVGENRTDRSDTKSASQIHKKRTKSTVNTIYSLPPSVVSAYDSPSTLAFQTSGDNNNNTQQWTWRPAAHFSSRGTPNTHRFRSNFFNSMRQKLQQVLPEGLEMGRQSGMFWYPPGGVREWHNNYLDLVGTTKKGKTDSEKRDEDIFASQVWRMYFVRTVRDKEFDEKLRNLRSKETSRNKAPGVDATVDESVNDYSAMHIIPGDDDGITLEVLQKAGARPLTENEKKRRWSDIFAEDDENVMNAANDTNDRSSVWRLPDLDGYVTLFRLPKLWHCIISEEVHRFSLGFAFSDREVQALLKLAGVEFEVLTDVNQNDSNLSILAKDEL